MIELNYLLDLLRNYFTNKVPKNKDITIEDIKVIQGQQTVIDYIQGILDKEERNRSSDNTELKPPRG